MAKNTTYGKPFFPSTGPYLFAGSFFQTLFSRILQGGVSAEDGITAHAGGTQAAGYVLNNSINRVATVGSAGDSVVLPPAIQGSILILDNASGTSMNVFGAVGSGNTINGTAGTTAFAVAGAKSVTFKCLTKGAWVTSTAAIP